MKYIPFLLAVLYIFNGCSSKNEDYNKPATFWYNKMLDEITTFELDKADETFISLESEHQNSPLLPVALLIISDAHIQNQEYILAIYYYDLYIQKFDDNSLEDYIRYLKIKAKFKAFKYQYRDQKLIDDTLKDIALFIKRYHNSKYIYLVKTIQSRLYMSQSLFDIEIANLYSRKDKPKSSEFYMLKAKSAWEDIDSIKRPHIPIYRRIFE